MCSVDLLYPASTNVRSMQAHVSTYSKLEQPANIDRPPVLTRNPRRNNVNVTLAI